MAQFLFLCIYTITSIVLASFILIQSSFHYLTMYPTITHFFTVYPMTECVFRDGSHLSLPLYAQKSTWHRAGIQWMWCINKWRQYYKVKIPTTFTSKTSHNCSTELLPQFTLLTSFCVYVEEVRDH